MADDKSRDIAIAPEWKSILAEEFAQPYFSDLRKKVRSAYLSGNVHPHPTRVFRAFNLCAPKDVRVVILGQDPYHTPGVADGLAFSSFEGSPIPPSLENMYKEIEAEFGNLCTRSPDLTRWAMQGVLLLNTSLTVKSGAANSHLGFGWHIFTDAVIRILSRDYEHIVFMLWGNNARQKKNLIDATKHLILESPHPSPLSAHKGFLGNGHFQRANDYLHKCGRGEIKWC